MSGHRQQKEAPRTRAPVEFDLFSPYGGGEEEEDEASRTKLSTDEQDMKRAIFGTNRDVGNNRNDIFVGDNDEITGSGSGMKPPVTVFPDIRARYLVDKVEAVQNSVPPYERPDDLTRKFSRTELDRVLEWNDEHNRREERMWDDPEYAFVRQVQGLAADETLVTGPSGLPIGIDDDLTGFGFASKNTLELHDFGGQSGASKDPKKRGSDDETSDPREGSNSKKQKGLRGSDVPVHSFDYADDDDNCKEAGSPHKATGARISKKILSGMQADDIFVDDDVLDAGQQLDRVRVMKNVQKQANKPAVSGILRLHNKLIGAIRQSLSDLTQRNYEKFRNKSREHFYHDAHAMGLFAALTAANIALINIRAATTYYKDADNRRRRNEIAITVKQMDTDLVWNNSKKCFVQATTEQRKHNRLRALMPPSLQWQYNY